MTPLFSQKKRGSRILWLASRALLLAVSMGLLLPASLPPAHAFENRPPPLSISLYSQGTTRDVAVTSVLQVGPPFANEGAVVTIQVAVMNNGSNEETFTVELKDETEDRVIGTVSVTLAAETSTTVTFQWNTTGASGGPAPPGPPTPGTIHVLTARATLPGDANSGNDSMSLLPGIWIIAAPEDPKITFPDTLKEPQSLYGDESSLEEPAIRTEMETLSSFFLGPVERRESYAFASAIVITEVEALSQVYNSPTQQHMEFSLATPDIAVSGTKLASIFAAPIQERLTLAFSDPEIATVAQKLTRILADEPDARLDQFLLVPGITTEAAPLTSILVKDSSKQPVNALSLSNPTLGTSAAPLTAPFSSPVEARLTRTLSGAPIVTNAMPLTKILSDFEQSRALVMLSNPDIGTRATGLTELFKTAIDSEAVHGIKTSGIATYGKPLSQIYSGPVHAEIARRAHKPEVATEAKSLGQLVVLGGATTYQPGQGLMNPFTGAEISGRIKLQGAPDSLGSYVLVGDEVTFADKEGNYQATVPVDTFDLRIMAPGHVSVLITGISPGLGDSLAMPEVTLPFGDANGDGLVDIYDISVAALNYGTSVTTLPAP